MIRDLRPGYDGLERVCYIAVAYAYPGYDAEETHETDDTGAVWQNTSVLKSIGRRG